MKNKRGITLIALIITIIVLLILAGVTINMVLGENGLFNKAKASVGKYENAQAKENTTLEGYETEIDNARDSITISKDEYNSLLQRLETIENKTNYDNPKLITNINKAYDSSTHTAGTYYCKSSSIYTKTITNNGNDYIEFIQNEGFKIKKSGYYLINATMGADVYSGNWCDISSGIIIDNSTNIILTKSIVANNLSEDRQTNSISIFLKENSIIDFYLTTNTTTTYCGGSINIYSMF